MMRIPLTYCPYCHAENKFKTREHFKCGTKGFEKRYHQTKHCRLVEACIHLVNDKNAGYATVLKHIEKIERIVK